MHYILTPQADSDLQGIWHYTEKAWGATQAVTYLEALEATFDAIANGKAQTRPSPTGEKGLNYIRCEHHYIFFVQASPVQIIRVLHERMDFLERLKERLQ